MATEVERALFSKEELAERVRVPVDVEQDLKQIISDRLEQCGLYFRVFSRIKTAASMARKFEQKVYGEKRKLQDLVGVRINLYFDDDVEICKNIMEHIFDVVGWSFSERSEDEFKPTKLNGVFRLPLYLRAMISPDTWDMNIDDTFEIQIKTVFFEGWHEIEHDMRYKGEELWKDYGDFSRYLNSILATLELCDKSMVTLFEELGHSLYKSGRWSDMIKSHFRVKLGDVPMYPELEEFLNEDHDSGDNIAKKIYKTRKADLIELLLKRTRKIPVNVNTIVAVLNDGRYHNGRLSAILRERDVYNDGREDSLAESRHYEMRPLVRQSVFQMSTEVDGNRVRGEEVTPQLIFDRASDSIYRWTLQKYGTLFPDMPLEKTTWRADLMAYHVSIKYDAVRMRMNMHVRHIDPDIGGRIWYCEASLSAEPDEGMCKEKPEAECNTKPANGCRAEAMAGSDTEQADGCKAEAMAGRDAEQADGCKAEAMAGCDAEQADGSKAEAMAGCDAEQADGCKERSAAGCDAELTDGCRERSAAGCDRVSHGKVNSEKGKRIWLKVNNGYAEPPRDTQLTDLEVGRFFSYPGFYKNIVDNIGIVNGMECMNRRRILREDMIDIFDKARRDSDRAFPLILIISREGEDGLMDEGWLGAFRVSDFTRTVWRYAHVFTCYETVGRKLLKMAGMDDSSQDAVPRLYLFWPDGQVDLYGPEDVENCSFGRHIEMRGDITSYDFVRGGQAFYHKIVTELRDWNVSAKMWTGFKLDILTEIPD